MQHVKITRSDYDFDTDQWQTETVSSFLVGPDGIVQVEEGAEQIPRGGRRWTSTPART
jgi:hypothetical protein